MKTLISIILFSNLLYAGNEVGNGGDSIVEEFIRFCEIAQKEISEYQKSKPFGTGDFSHEDLNRVCNPDLVSIESTTEKLFVQEENTEKWIEKTAVNNSEESWIKINRSRWLQLPTAMKFRLTSHEVLGFLNIDDFNYSYTKDILKNFKYSSLKIDSAYSKMGRITWHNSKVESIQKLISKRLDHISDAEYLDLVEDFESEILSSIFEKGATNISLRNVEMDFLRDQSLEIPDKVKLSLLKLNLLEKDFSEYPVKASATKTLDWMKRKYTPMLMFADSEIFEAYLLKTMILNTLYTLESENIFDSSRTRKLVKLIEVLEADDEHRNLYQVRSELYEILESLKSSCFDCDSAINPREGSINRRPSYETNEDSRVPIQYRIKRMKNEESESLFSF